MRKPSLASRIFATLAENGLVMDADISLTTVEQRSTVTTTESTTPLLTNRARARNRCCTSESEEAREWRLARGRARRR